MPGMQKKNGRAPGTCSHMFLISPKYGDFRLFSDSSVLCDIRVSQSQSLNFQLLLALCTRDLVSHHYCSTLYPIQCLSLMLVCYSMVAISNRGGKLMVFSLTERRGNVYYLNFV